MQPSLWEVELWWWVFSFEVIRVFRGRRGRRDGEEDNDMLGSERSEECKVKKRSGLAVKK